MRLEPNVVIRKLRSAGTRLAVEVGGIRMAAVMDVSIQRQIKERVSDDGWVVREPDGEPVVLITLPLRCVSFKEPPNDTPNASPEG